jgi:hypothetical protein
MVFEFPDKVDSIETVPEEYRAAYVDAGEGEGFTIQDSFKPFVSAIGSLNKTLSGTRSDKKKATDEAGAMRILHKNMGEFVSELGVEVTEEDLLGALKGYVSDLTTKVKNGEEMGINLEKIKAESKKLTDEKVGEANARTEKMERALHKHLIGDVAVRALTNAGAISVDLLLPHLEKKCKVVQDGETFSVRVLDADGEARSDGKGGWLSLEDAAIEMKANEKYTPAFKSEAKGGTGANAGETKRTIRPGGNQQAEKSSVEKITAGLQEGLHKQTA